MYPKGSEGGDMKKVLFLLIILSFFGVSLNSSTTPEHQKESGEFIPDSLLGRKIGFELDADCRNPGTGCPSGVI